MSTKKGFKTATRATGRVATKTKATPSRRRAPVQRPSAAALLELEDVLQGIGEAVAACVKARRFQDLKKTLIEFGGLLGLDPAFLFNTVILRQLVAHFHTLTDPVEAATFGEYVLAAEACTRTPMTLDEAVGEHEAVATLVDARCSNQVVDAFFTIDTPADGRVS